MEQDRKVTIYLRDSEKIEDKDPRGAKELFLLNADRFKTVMRDKVYKNVPEGTIFHSVIGGLSSLHLLEKLNPAKAVFLDVNPVQVAFCEAYLNLIRDSDSYYDLWKRYYCRDFGDDIMKLAETPPNPDWDIYEGFKREVPKVAKRLKDAKPTDDTHPRYKTHDKTTHDYDYTYGLQKNLKLPEGLYPWHSVVRHPGYPCCGVHHIYDGMGFHCEEGFQWVKQWLLTHETECVNLSMFEYDYPENSYIYSTNVWGLFRQRYIPFLQKYKHRIEKDIWFAGDSHRVLLKDGEPNWIN